MKLLSAILFLAATLVACSEATVEGEESVRREREPIVGLPCEGCELVFEGMPESIPWSARIASQEEAGDAMRIDGVVRDREGKAASGVIVYAYQTNAKGVYPPQEGSDAVSTRHGRLRAWTRTDESGRYRFETIRPGGYPGTVEPEHVHLHVIEEGRCTYYIQDLRFDDDPRLTETMRQQLTSGRGGVGLVSPTRSESGTWLVQRDIVLGEGIPGYPKDD